jgi:lysophospholipase L1-like esterase
VVAARLAATGVAAGAAALFALRLGRVAGRVRRGRALAARTPRFEREGPEAAPALLALGDSLAIGVGAQCADHSVPGRIAATFDHLVVHHRAVCGARMRDLDAQLGMAPRARYTVLFIAAGANDVLRGTPWVEVERALVRFLARATARADLVVMVVSANVGGAPALPWALRGLFTARSRRMRDLAARTCARAGAHFVDLFHEPRDDFFARDPQRYFGVDGLHPSSESYRICYERVCATAPLHASLRR